MADDQDSVQVHLAVKRMSRRAIPYPKLLEMFEMNDRSCVVLAEVAAVEEIHVNRRRDDSMRRQQLAQVQVSRGGILEWVMIAVRKHGQREGTPAAGHANMPVERHVGVEKRPRSGPQVGEHSDVDPRGQVG